MIRTAEAASAATQQLNGTAGGHRMHYPPIADSDVEMCQALMWALLERMIHDACGATCSGHSYKTRLRIAREAHRWLHSRAPAAARDRWQVCEFLGIAPQSFDERMAMGAVPYPCEATMRASWTTLELVYWRLAGGSGAPPKPRAERALQYVKRRRTTRAARTALLTPHRYPATIARRGRCADAAAEA